MRVAPVVSALDRRAARHVNMRVLGSRHVTPLRFGAVASGLTADLSCETVAMDSAASAQATRLERFAAHLNLLRVHSDSSVFPRGTIVLWYNSGQSPLDAEFNRINGANDLRTFSSPRRYS